MNDDFWGGLFGLFMLALPFIWLAITGISNETCKADKEWCSDYLRCSYYGEHCQPDWTDAMNSYISRKQEEKRNQEKLQYIQTLRNE